MLKATHQADYSLTDSFVFLLERLCSRKFVSQIRNEPCGSCTDEIALEIERRYDKLIFRDIYEIVKGADSLVRLPRFTQKILYSSFNHLSFLLNEYDRANAAKNQIQIYSFCRQLEDLLFKITSYSKRCINDERYLDFYRVAIPLSNTWNYYNSIMVKYADVLYDSLDCFFTENMKFIENIDLAVGNILNIEISEERKKTIAANPFGKKRNRRKRRASGVGGWRDCRINLGNEIESNFGIISFNREEVVVYTKENLDVREYQADISFNSIDLLFYDSTLVLHENNAKIVRKLIKQKGSLFSIYSHLGKPNIYVMKYKVKRELQGYMNAICMEQACLEKDIGGDLFKNAFGYN